MSAFTEEQMMPRPDYRLVGAIERPDHPLRLFRGQDVKKTYYSIGQVAQMLKVRPSKIRFWLPQFNVEVKKNAKGFRFFTEQDIEKVKLIYTLRVVEGLELWAARKRFKQLARI